MIQSIIAARKNAGVMSGTELKLFAKSLSAKSAKEIEALFKHEAGRHA